jgi:NADH:ubiquinone oxidoreductase subunit 3 (subunit A)
MLEYIYSPAVLFLVFLLFVALLSYGFSFLAYKGKGKASSGESYACGEEHYDIFAQPDYSHFFPFAFFFTIAHVATLMFATIPFVIPSVFAAAVLYIAALLVGLYILLWR